MRNIFTKSLAFAALAAVYSVNASASNKSYFVASYYLPNSERSIQSTESEVACLDAPLHGQWCLPIVSASATFEASNATPQNSRLQYQSYELETYSLSPETVAQLLTEDGRFGRVEVDPIVRTPQRLPTTNSNIAGTTTATDDPSAAYTEFYMGSSDHSPVGLGIYKSWDIVEYKRGEKPIDVIVTDSSFFENDDIIYAEGRNFSTTILREGEERQKRSDDFRPDPQQVEEGLCSGHGVGVASVIGGIIGNGQGVAGITNNVNIHPIRTMSCGSGLFSDSIDAISWLLGDDFRQSERVSPYEGAVGIVNMSLAARSGTCPRFAQEVINKATAAGWTIVVSASNDYSDVTDYVPANCDNVITVGALDKNAERAPFSNVGEEIELMVAGVDIAGTCDESGSDCYWAGTSFAAPLVSGMVAILKQYSDLPSDVLTMALELSATQEVLGDSCPKHGCGAGVPNLRSAIAIVESIENGELGTITHALSNSDSCEKTWFFENFSEKVGLCELYEVTFSAGFYLPGAEFELLSKKKNREWEDEPTVVRKFDFSIGYLRNIDVQTNDYGYRICRDGSCKGVILDLNTEGASDINKPLECDG